MAANEHRRAGAVTGQGSTRANGQSRAKVQAARLRLVTDRKQGKDSPGWVKRLAAQDQG